MPSLFKEQSHLRRDLHCVCRVLRAIPDWARIALAYPVLVAQSGIAGDALSVGSAYLDARAELWHAFDAQA